MKWRHPQDPPSRKHVRRIIKADGTEILLDRKHSVPELEKLIDSTIFDHFALMPDARWICLVDDEGHQRQRPLNEKATLLYWDRCGGVVDHFIVGDVAIVPVSDLE